MVGFRAPTDLSAEDIWRTYVLLTRVEAAFRAMKSPLCQRPENNFSDRTYGASRLVDEVLHHPTTPLL